MRLLLILGSFSLFAADPPTTNWADRPGAEPLNKELPHWVQVSGEYRVRFEGFSNGGFRAPNDDLYVLHRVRLNLRLKPAPWLQFFGQVQDARVWVNDRAASLPPLQDRFDLRQAYVEIGDSEAKLMALRAGRQELGFGEERLIGSSNWTNTSRTFDAVRLNLRHKGYRLAVWAGSVVVSRDGEWNHHAQGSNLHGLYASVESWIPKAKVEPFAFWRLAPRVRAENGVFGKLDFKTVGVRIAGALTKKTDYVTEMAFQRGSASRDDVEAWAGHWRIEQTLGSSPMRPRLRVEYNHATGDNNPADGKLRTFDNLYPTGHDKYGLDDQVGWRNIRHAAAIFEIKPRPKLTVQAKFHTWNLASERDGLYNSGGTLVFRDATGRSGTHVGEELDAQMLWTFSKQILIGMGIGHIFPGEFLKSVAPGKGFTFPYIMLTYLL